METSFAGNSLAENLPSSGYAHMAFGVGQRVLAGF